MRSTTGTRPVLNKVFLTAVLLAGGTALAQPGGAPAPDQPPDPVIPQPPEPQVRPPQPPQPPVVHETAEAKVEDTGPIRPDGFAVGIGVGYRFPTALSIPNAASVRFRLPNAITIEPTLVLATSSAETDVGTTQGSSATEVGIGATARFSVVGRRRTDLELLAGFAVDRVSQDPSDQQSDDVRTTTATSFSYGVAVGLWITKNLQLSLQTTNSLVTYVHGREEQGPGFVTVTNQTTFGLIFDPNVTFMVHLYN